MPERDHKTIGIKKRPKCIKRFFSLGNMGVWSGRFEEVGSFVGAEDVHQGRQETLTHGHIG